MLTRTASSFLCWSFSGVADVPLPIQAEMLPSELEFGEPDDLQFRMVGTDLVLIDTHASLIVDFLPREVPDQLP